MTAKKAPTAKMKKLLAAEEQTLSAWQDANEEYEIARTEAWEARLRHREAKGRAMRATAVQERLWADHNAAEQAVTEERRHEFTRTILAKALKP